MIGFKDLWLHDRFSFRLHHIDSVFFFFEDDLWFLSDEVFSFNDEHMKRLTISPWNSDGFQQVSYLEAEHEKSEDNTVGDASRSMARLSNSRCSVSISRLLVPGLSWFLSKNEASTGIYCWSVQWTLEDVDGSNKYTCICIHRLGFMIYRAESAETKWQLDMSEGDKLHTLDVGSCWRGHRLHH